MQKNYTKKSHTPRPSKKKHKIEVPFSLFPKCIKGDRKTKKIEKKMNSGIQQKNEIYMYSNKLYKKIHIIIVQET